MNEIRSQSVLRTFGSLLAVTHILTCLFWLAEDGHYVIAFTDSLPLCWPFLNGCEAWGRLTPGSLFAILTLYSVLAGISAYLFFSAKWSRVAFWLLAAVSLIKLGLFLLDYRLSGNYHYMHFWVLAAFFLVAQKTLTIRFLVLGFYLGAGVIKLNKEWLTGAVFPGNFFLEGFVLSAACVYVVLLELIFVFGLLAKARWIFWLTLAQLFVFHVFSYFVVGFFYPLLMFSFLALFILCEKEAPGDFSPRRIKDLNSGSRIFLTLLVLGQIVPWLLGGDRAVDGRGRLVALTMFDAGTICEFKVVARFEEGKISLPSQYSRHLDARLKCDPHVMLADARHRCAELSGNPQFIALDISLMSKRKTDAKYREVFNFENYCADPKRMNFLGLIR